MSCQRNDGGSFMQQRMLDRRVAMPGRTKLWFRGRCAHLLIAIAGCSAISWLAVCLLQGSGVGAIATNAVMTTVGHDAHLRRLANVKRGFSKKSGDEGKREKSAVLPTDIDEFAKTNETAAELAGVKQNSRQDFGNFMKALGLYTTLSLLYLGAFCFLRVQFPLMFTAGAGVQAGLSAGSLTLFGWLKPAIDLNMEELQFSIGLDNVMLLEFIDLCIKLFTVIGAWMVLVMCPLHYFYGHGKVDKLSRLGMAALEVNSDVYWVHTCTVWGIVLFTQRAILSAQRVFVKRRHRWLANLQEPRANTVLVRRIPPEYRSDVLLREYFQEKLFSKSHIKHVAVVKHTSNLKQLVQQRDLAKQHQLHCAPHLENGCCARFMRNVLGIDHPPEPTLQTLQGQVETKREEIRRLAAQQCGVNTSNAFIMFSTARDAELALSMQIGADLSEWLLLIPPEPQHVNWDHLSQEPSATVDFLSNVAGWTFVALLFVLFGPIVSSISSIGARFPALGAIIPSLGLFLFTSFLPTMLMLIFRLFFSVESEYRLQLQLYHAYFWFQVIFVLLVPAVGSSLLLTLEELVEKPTRIAILLAETMPTCSHFYLSYNVLHFASQTLNLTRYWQLMKYIYFVRGHEAGQAAEFSEPEDQDYYGLGSRSARWAIMALIGIFFSQLDPIISVVALMNFALCRLCYGYLIVFSETRKFDSGGLFWVSQLWGVQHGISIYVVLMTGVLSMRAGLRQALIAGSSWLYLLWCQNRLSQIAWQRLPFELIPRASDIGKIPGQDAFYIQPELTDAEDPPARIHNSEPTPFKSYARLDRISAQTLSRDVSPRSPRM